MRTRILIVGVLILAAISAMAYAQPLGASTQVGTPQTISAGTPGNATAQGGNITLVNLTGRGRVNAWQGFYGQVAGNFSLEDTTGDVLYSWDITNHTGEVYASRFSTIDFTTVAGVTTCTVDEDLTGNGRERTNRTFFNATVNFTIGTVSITAACRAYTYVNNATSTNWEEIIINATGVTSIYVVKINETTAVFDGSLQDYQMIVPDNRTSATTVYYFYTEFDDTST